MTYAAAIEKMVRWRRIEWLLLWVGLAWPLLLFLLNPAPILMGWLCLLVIFLFVHHKRKAHRNTARKIHEETD
jgi:1,4-dihydroxy-2-naphthoate octaprenyltransferase